MTSAAKSSIRRVTLAVLSFVLVSQGGLAADRHARLSGGFHTNSSMRVPGVVVRGDTIRLPPSRAPQAGPSGKFTDRCRTIVEFAQLGEHDDKSIRQLRKSCG